MHRRIFAMVLALCLVLSGCSGWPDGSYVSVKPHADAGLPQDQSIADVKNYNQLYAALVNLIEKGDSKLTLSVDDYDRALLEPEMKKAIRNVCSNNPIGAYAVADITYEFGVTGGVFALSVSVEYNHNHSRIGKMKHVQGMEAVALEVKKSLESCASDLVILISGYHTTDYLQLIADYAATYPSKVMEIPQLTVNIYPEGGSYRVLELLFNYQNSKENLKSMQSYVQPIMEASTLYISVEESSHSRYSKLYTFLMERNQYKQDTSLTPAYSLLRHGVGDSRAFAIVYEEMCRRAGLECMTVSGTRAGEQWYWNIVCDEGVYYHLDLIQAHRTGGFVLGVDADMTGYVWDYSAYPACGPQEQQEETQQQTQPSEETENPSEPVGDDKEDVGGT